MVLVSDANKSCEYVKVHKQFPPISKRLEFVLSGVHIFFFCVGNLALVKKCWLQFPRPEFLPSSSISKSEEKYSQHLRLATMRHTYFALFMTGVLTLA